MLRDFSGHKKYVLKKNFSCLPVGCIIITIAFNLQFPTLPCPSKRLILCCTEILVKVRAICVGFTKVFGNSSAVQTTGIKTQK